MDKRNGFSAHDESVAHKCCMAKWNEQRLRQDQNLDVSTLVNEKVLEKYLISLNFLLSMNCRFEEAMTRKHAVKKVYSKRYSNTLCRKTRTLLNVRR